MYIEHRLCTDPDLGSSCPRCNTPYIVPCLMHSTALQLACCKAVQIGTLSSGLLDSTASRRSSCLARQHAEMMSTNRFGMSSDLLASRRQAMATICIAAVHR